MSDSPANAAAPSAVQARRTLDEGESAAARLHSTSTAPEGWLLLVIAAGIACYFAASFLGVRASQLTGTALAVLLVAIAVLGVAFPFLLRRHRTIRPRHFPTIETAAIVASVLLGAAYLQIFRGAPPGVSDALSAGFTAVLPLAACALFLIVRSMTLGTGAHTVGPPGPPGDRRFTLLAALTRVHCASPSSLGAAAGLPLDELAAEAAGLERQGLIMAQERLISPRDTAEVRLTVRGRLEVQERTEALLAAAGPSLGP
ncbi:hypothetical protein I6N91_05275 [Arthrobacter sp. MSA 4-2]|uniref:hypothetical protein n=1 Tax=Arthrobacter sp. MSA 4-2 TaxID=2794349 RepID=UPI0018E855EA|nr:hypothetical protein [Arthrobacter sp. MSA 4-2]MBJ2120387.1 hypothetical protein [Arthrobacter sp. MSA 4-2]